MEKPLQQRCKEKFSVLSCLFFMFIFVSSCQSSPPEERISSREAQVKDQFSSGQHRAKKPILNEEIFKKGEALYQKQCAVCHGISGASDGKAAYLLYPKARDFTRDKFRLVSTKNMEATDEDLFRTISRGMPGSAMPSWEHLAEKDRWALVYYVRYLSELENYRKTGEISDEMIATSIPWEIKKKIVDKKINPENIIEVRQEPPITSETLKVGRELFLASCAGCHGPEGRGDGQQEMKDNLGYPMRPRDLTAGIFKGSSASHDLYCRMIGGIPGSPMPSYVGALTEEQIWDLIHYVQSLTNPEAEARARLSSLKIHSEKVNSDIDLDPLAKVWSKVNSSFVALTPLWWRDNRIEGVEVKTLYNNDIIAFYLTWSDPTTEDDLVTVQSFSDGAALQFSMEKDPPFFGMGSKDNPVHIWHWKAGWEGKEEQRSDIETRYPHTAVDWYPAQKNYQHGGPFEASESKTHFHDPQFITGWGAKNPLSDPHRRVAEEATSEGLGTYTTQIPQVEEVQAKGVWQDGKWHVVFIRPLKSSEQESLQFKRGVPLSVAFAIWDGAGKDRDGQKMVSIWNNLILGK